MPAWDVRFDLRLDLDNPEIRSLTSLVEAQARLTADIPLPPSLQQYLDALNISRAVRGTTGIEGADLTEEEVQSILGAAPGTRVLPPTREREEMEARNAARVMRYVAAAEETAVTESLICRIHELTTAGIDYPDNVPGQYRSHPTHAGGYVPPRTNQDIRRLMREFTEWINTGERTSWHPAVGAIVAHFYVVSIHPFGDGNGRTARGLESFVLYQGGINVRSFYSLANFYYRERVAYIQMLDHVRFRSGGDLTPFVLFALRGLKDELDGVREAVVAGVRLVAFRDYAREQLFGADSAASPQVALRMFRLVIAIPDGGVSLSEIRRGDHPLGALYRGVTSKTLSRDVNRLKLLSLIDVDRDLIRPNLSVLERFVR